MHGGLAGLGPFQGVADVRQLPGTGGHHRQQGERRQQGLGK